MYIHITPQGLVRTHYSQTAIFYVGHRCTKLNIIRKNYGENTFQKNEFDFSEMLKISLHTWSDKKYRMEKALKKKCEKNQHKSENII